MAQKKHPRNKYSTRAAVLTAILVTLAGINTAVTAQMFPSGSWRLQSQGGTQQQINLQNGGQPSFINHQGGMQGVRPSAPDGGSTGRSGNAGGQGCPDATRVQMTLLQQIAQLRAALDRLQQVLEQSGSTTGGGTE